jgi:hypothetical protein
VSEAAPEVPRRAPGTPGSSPAGGTGFSKKFGPLPAWAWVLLAAAGGVAYIWWKNHQNASAASAADTAATAADTGDGTGDDAGSIATLQSEIQQLQGAASTPAATASSAAATPTADEKTKVLTVPRAETLAAYSKAMKWTPATLKAVEALNGLSASSKLKKGQHIVRPVNKSGVI